MVCPHTVQLVGNGDAKKTNAANPGPAPEEERDEESPDQDEERGGDRREPPAQRPILEPHERQPPDGWAAAARRSYGAGFHALLAATRPGRHCTGGWRPRPLPCSGQPTAVSRTAAVRARPDRR